MKDGGGRDGYPRAIEMEERWRFLLAILQRILESLQHSLGCAFLGEGTKAIELSDGSEGDESEERTERAPPGPSTRSREQADGFFYERSYGMSVDGALG